jgi:nitrate reductase molybdenum cofactor assembly chaperone
VTGDAGIWDLTASLLEYPADGAYVARARAAAQRAQGGPAADSLARLCHQLEAAIVTRLQERYADAFDFDPETTLDVGAHLFGNGPQRGPWLAELAGALDARGVTRNGELPDHLGQLLRLVAREDDERAAGLAAQIAPAVARIAARLTARANPFAPLVQAAGALLESTRVRSGHE